MAINKCTKTPICIHEGCVHKDHRLYMTSYCERINYTPIYDVFVFFFPFNHFSDVISMHKITQRCGPSKYTNEMLGVQSESKSPRVAF
jgi:hypothetical protein